MQKTVVVRFSAPSPTACDDFPLAPSPCATIFCSPRRASGIAAPLSQQNSRSMLSCQATLVGRLDSFRSMGHSLICIETRAGALTNLLPQQGGLPKGDAAENGNLADASSPLGSSTGEPHGYFSQCQQTEVVDVSGRHN